MSFSAGQRLDVLLFFLVDDGLLVTNVLLNPVRMSCFLAHRLVGIRQDLPDALRVPVHLLVLVVLSVGLVLLVNVAVVYSCNFDDLPIAYPKLLLHNFPKSSRRWNNVTMVLFRIMQASLLNFRLGGFFW